MRCFVLGRVPFPATIVRVLLAAAVCSGCVGGSSMTTLDNLTKGAEGRREQLAERMERYHHALHWGDADEAIAFIAADSRRDAYPGFRKRFRLERVTECELEELEFDGEVKEAVANVRISFYEKAALVVKTRRERETWEFRAMEGGWFLRNVEYSDVEEKGTSEEVGGSSPSGGEWNEDGVERARFGADVLH